MTSPNINFEIDVLSKKYKFMTDEESKLNETIRLNNLKKSKFVQHLPFFKKIKLTYKKYYEIEDHFNNYYEFAKSALRKNSKGILDKEYYDSLNMDFVKNKDYKDVIEITFKQLYIDRNRMGTTHFPGVRIIENREKSKVNNKILEAHPAILTAVYFLYTFDKNRIYVNKVIDQRKKNETFYHATSIYGQGSYLMALLLGLSDISTLDAFVILFLLDKKTEMQQLNEAYQRFDFNMFFFIMAVFILIKVQQKNFWKPLFDKYQDQSDFNIILGESLRGFLATATMTPGLIVNVVAGYNKKITTKYKKSIEDLCYHLYDKGPSFIICLLSANVMNVIQDIKKVLPKNDTDLDMDMLTMNLIKSQSTWNKDELPVKLALEIYNKIVKKTKYKSVNKFFCKLTKFLREKRFMFSTKPHPPSTKLKELIGFDRYTLKRLFEKDDNKHYHIDFIALNKFKILKNQKGGRKKHKTLRKSRKYYDGWELVKKKSKRKTIKYRY